MSPSARLTATLDLIEAIDAVARPADATVSAWLRERRGIPPRDRAAIVALLQTFLRHRARLDWWLARHERPSTPRGRLLAWLALGEARTADEIRGLFGGGRDAPAALTDEERALLARLKGHTIDHPAMPEAVRLECPPWAEEPLRRRFGAAFGREMAAALAPPPLDLRVNPLKTTREAMLRALRDLGLKAAPTRFAPHGIRVNDRTDLAALPMLASGEVEIQDEGSQLVAQLVGAAPGMRVVDVCAGAGGKTLALAAAMENRGRLVACDVSDGRLRRAAERLRRAGIHIVETRLLASETDRWIKRHKAAFDRVLVDAPCSGTGTWRRNPDARWRVLGAGLETLLPLQARILASAARLVKPGGRLVYATCSLLPEENEAQVEAFLAANPGWRVVPVGEEPEAGVYMSLTPGRDGTDGFFAAVVEREGATAPSVGTARNDHMCSLPTISNAGREQAHRDLESSWRLKPNFVDRIEKEPRFLRPVQPAIEARPSSDCERILEICIDVLDANEKGGPATIAQSFGFSPEFVRLPRAGVGQDHRSKPISEVAPVEPLPSPVRQPRLVQIHAGAGRAGDLREASDQWDRSAHGCPPAFAG